MYTVYIYIYIYHDTSILFDKYIICTYIYIYIYILATIYLIYIYICHHTTIGDTSHFLSLNTIWWVGFSPVSAWRLGLSLPHGIVACVRGPFVRKRGKQLVDFSEKSRPYNAPQGWNVYLDLLPISSMYGILNLHFGMFHTVDGSEIWLKPVDVDSLSQYSYGFTHHPRWWRISEPSTVGLEYFLS